MVSKTTSSFTITVTGKLRSVHGPVSESADCKVKPTAEVDHEMRTRSGRRCWILSLGLNPSVGGTWITRMKPLEPLGNRNVEQVVVATILAIPVQSGGKVVVAN